MRKKLITAAVPVLIVVVVLLFLTEREKTPSYSASVLDAPAFSGEPYIHINDNQPEFTDDDMTATAYEFYSELDSLGRCGYTMACIGPELMPAEDRESISHIKPTGWVQAQYSIVDGENLYNRCHLIGFQLTGENANEQNLITGTRYMNVEGMLPFENMVADYIKETGYHVLYRVTPVFDGSNLVARGVQMEAKSVEDDGDGICFHVYVYNVQPGVTINYTDGTSFLNSSIEETDTFQTNSDSITYILNTKSKKFHDSSCNQGKSISQENRKETSEDRQSLIEVGYIPAGCCKP